MTVSCDRPVPGIEFGDFSGTDFLDFSNNMPKGSPETPGRQPPTHREFVRNGAKGVTLTMPDGVDVEFWSFEDENGVAQVPSTQIRVTEGDLVHVHLKASKSVHTIHHHGIEPESYNDGVGHTSFEADDYTYQWKPYEYNVDSNHDPTVGKAGSYVYHCHVNTVLHAQMFLAGTLVVDPKQYSYDPATRAGFRRPFRNCRFIYDVTPGAEMERYWATMAADPRWHKLDHAAGLDGGDVGLNHFQPRYFLLNGVAALPGLDRASRTRSDPRVAILNAKMSSFSPDTFADATPNNPQRGILIRLINAHYYPQIVDFGSLMGKIIASDGSPFPTTQRDAHEKPIVNLDRTDGRAELDLAKDLPGGLLQMSPFERYDVMICPTSVGTFPITFRYYEWTAGSSVAAIQTVIKVS